MVTFGISDGLYIIDPSNGSTVKIGDFLYEGNPILMSGAAFSPNGTLYVAKSHQSFKVDLATAALTYIGAPTAIIWDLEFAPDATLYGAFGDLFILNTDDMSTITTVGHTGAPYIGPITFDKRGTLFGMDIYPSTHIYTVSLENGAATPILTTGSIGLASIVAERELTPAATATIVAKRAAYASVNHTPSQEALLVKERELKAAQRH